MREEKRRSMMIRRYGTIGVVALASLIVLITVVVKQKDKINPREIPSATEMASEQLQATETEQPTEEPWSFEAHETDQTADLPETVVSKHGILINADTGEILAERGGRERIVPASMTKVMTVLVAAEHISEDQLDDKVKLTKEVADYSYVNDCSNTGFELDEPITVRDLFYGTILPSGADSAVSLANYVAGSHEAFVDMMNEKLDELGLSDTAHMTNCVGLYDENHYCSVYDMAIILKAAMDNPICREVMSAHTYNTSITTQHPEGILLSNWFLRRIEDKDCGGEVLCAKTGYVVQSGNCAASYALDQSGNGYLCVTAHSTSSWRCIYDHVALYQQFLN